MSFKFPNIAELKSYPQAYRGASINDGITSQEWLEIVMNDEWERLNSDKEDELGTPQVLWWEYLRKSVEFIVDEKKIERKQYQHDDGLPVDESFTVFIDKITKAYWEYFWLQLLGDRLDTAFDAISLIGHTSLSDDQRKRLKGIQSKLRKFIGLKSNPKKSYSANLTKKQNVPQLRELAKDVERIFFEFGIQNKKMISEYIAALHLGLNILEGQESTLIETIRTSHLQHKTPRI